MVGWRLISGYGLSNRLIAAVKHTTVSMWVVLGVHSSRSAGFTLSAVHLRRRNSLDKHCTVTKTLILHYLCWDRRLD